MALVRARCFRHPEREGAVRCPACARDFCRECVSEHAGRYLCAGCLAKPPEEKKRATSPWIVRTLAACLGFAALTAMMWCFGALLNRLAPVLETAAP